jgi:hypothetical protein
LGPDKEPVDSLTSNIGHCLWSGIVDDDHAPMVAKNLLSPQMWNGWGIRTLADDERAYDPMSYHCGTVWPHDGALCAAGLKAYGFEEEALTVARGLLAASQAWNGRLPECFSGLDRADVETPIPFPTSCSPQAWAAATPFLLLRIMLGLEPDDEHGLIVDPIPGAIEDDLLFAGVRLVALSASGNSAKRPRWPPAPSWPRRSIRLRPWKKAPQSLRCAGAERGRGQGHARSSHNVVSISDADRDRRDREHRQVVCRIADREDRPTGMTEFGHRGAQSRSLVAPRRR